MLWLVLDYSADILYGVDVLVRARTGEWAWAPGPRSHNMQQSGGRGGGPGAWGQVQGDPEQSPLGFLFVDSQKSQGMLPVAFRVGVIYRELKSEIGSRRV